MIPIISQKTLTTLLRKIVKEEVTQIAGDLHVTALRQAFDTFHRQQLEKTLQDLHVVQAKNEQLVYANITLSRRCIVLEQVLQGLGQDEVRKALAGVVDKLAIRSKEEGMDHA